MPRFTKPQLTAAIQATLRALKPPRIILPADAGLLLARASRTRPPAADGAGNDDVARMFAEYFQYNSRRLIANPVGASQLGWGASYIDAAAVNAIDDERALSLPTHTLHVQGDRAQLTQLPRTYVADLLWLFFWERFGIFQMLGALLDDYSTRGRFPLAHNDDTAVQLEAMVRLTNMGQSSQVRDRDSTYRRCLGWSSEPGRRLGGNSIVNTAFNTQFHRFIRDALTYYKEKRLISAISGAALQQMPSLATLQSIEESIRLLRNAMLRFDYGRNHTNTTAGVTWAIASFDLVKRTYDILGVPQTITDPRDYFVAARDVLTGNAPQTSSSNAYSLHRQCAITGRHILLYVDGLIEGGAGANDFTVSDNLRVWLNLLEEEIESYRAGYRALTGIDIGGGGENVEQAAA